MELKDLVGLHKLSAVDTGFSEDINGYGPAETISFTLDGITYTAMEDPQDGLRSCMSEIAVDKDRKMKNKFKPVKVVGRYVESYSRDILELIDIQTGETVLEVGTSDYNDYYPCFVSSWRPEGLAINKGE